MFTQNGQSAPRENPVGRDFFNAVDQNSVEVTTRERLVMAWENTMDLAKTFKRNSKIDEGTAAGALFDELAELQGICASKLHEFLNNESNGFPS